MDKSTNHLNTNNHRPLAGISSQHCEQNSEENDASARYNARTVSTRNSDGTLLFSSASNNPGINLPMFLEDSDVSDSELFEPDGTNFAQHDTQKKDEIENITQYLIDLDITKLSEQDKKKLFKKYEKYQKDNEIIRCIIDQKFNSNDSSESEFEFGSESESWSEHSYILNSSTKTNVSPAAVHGESFPSSRGMFAEKDNNQHFLCVDNSVENSSYGSHNYSALSVELEPNSTASAHHHNPLLQKKLKLDDVCTTLDSTCMTLEELKKIKANLPDGFSRQRKRTLNDRISRLEGMPPGTVESCTPAQNYLRKHSTTGSLDVDSQINTFMRNQEEGYLHRNMARAELAITKGESRHEAANRIKHNMEEAARRATDKGTETGSKEDRTKIKAITCRKCKRSDELFMRRPCNHVFYCTDHANIGNQCDFVDDNSKLCNVRTNHKQRVYFA